MRYPSYESRREHEYYHCHTPISRDSSTSSTPSLYYQPTLKEGIDTETEDSSNEDNIVGKFQLNMKLKKWKKQPHQQLRPRRLKRSMWSDKDSEFTLADWQCVLAIMALKQTYAMSTSTPQTPSCMGMYTLQLASTLSSSKVSN
jgi:hypothetical protein